MNIFEEAWLIAKAINYEHFDMSDILGDESFGVQKDPYYDVISQYLRTPKGKKELQEIKDLKIDYDLEGGDLEDYRPQSMWTREQEFRDVMGGSPGDVKDWQYLSKPGKMINRTFSLPTHMCMRGGQLREVEGSVCEGCYAHDGVTYISNPVQQKLMRNFNALKTSDPRLWASMFASDIPRETINFPIFRFHDSGELDSAEHFSMIADIAAKNPQTIFWLPTREWEMVRDVYNVRGSDMPNNLVPRISLPYINQTLDNDENERRGVPLLEQDIIDLLEEWNPKGRPGQPLIDYSTVIDNPDYKSSKSSLVCPAGNKKIKGKNTCESNRCTACFNPQVRAIDYPYH